MIRIRAQALYFVNECAIGCSKVAPQIPSPANATESSLQAFLLAMREHFPSLALSRHCANRVTHRLFFAATIIEYHARAKY